MCDCKSPEVWNESYPRARIIHKCCECNRPINVGTTYRLMKGLWDGCWDTYKMCLDCSALSDAFGNVFNERFMKETDCCHALGGLYEELINSDILCRDEEDEEIWIPQESWLKVACQHPLKCEVVEEAA